LHVSTHAKYIVMSMYMYVIMWSAIYRTRFCKKKRRNVQKLLGKFIDLGMMNTPTRNQTMKKHSLNSPRLLLLLVVVLPQ
jgi:hypothetical protein